MSLLNAIPSQISVAGRPTAAVLDIGQFQEALGQRRPGDLIAVAAASGPAVLGLTLASLMTRTPVFYVDRSAPTAWQEGLLARIAPSSVLRTDADGQPTLPWPVLLRGRPTRPADDIPDGTAYALSTSGTSGVPKIVLIGRDALDEHLTAAVGAFGLTGKDVVLQTASPGFDVWFEETLVTLAAGARLVLSPQGLRQTYDELHTAITRFGVTVLNLPAGYWHGWLSHLERRGIVPPPSLRLVIVGSEPIPRAAVERWRTLFPGRPRILCAYGLTETAVTAMLFDPQTQSFAAADSYAPLGKPLEGTRIRVDSTSELLIGGPRLMTGYLGDEPATRAALADIDGERWLRTGDFVRLGSDGIARFDGRRDDQVKIGGERVVLAEVEAGLRQVAGVSDVAVLQLDDGRIGAAISAVEGHTAEATREVFATRVPASHVPSRLVVLPALPRLSSGKVDRTALRMALNTGPAEVAQTADPLSLVTAHMSTLLGQHVDADTSFLALGGNSLLAAELLSRLQEHGLQLDFSGFFQSPTPRGVLATAKRSTPAAHTVITAVPAGSAVPLTRQQLIPWLHRQAYPGSLAYNAQTMIVLSGQVSLSAIQDAVNQLTARHDALRLGVTELDDGQPVQRAVGEPHQPVEFVDLMRLAPSHVDSAVEVLQRRLLAHRFVPSSPPLTRWVLVRLKPLEHHLYLIEDHLVHDGISFAVIMDELRAILVGEKLPAAQSAQYLDYAAWQHEQVSSGSYADRAAAAGVLLAGAPPLAALIAKASPQRQAGTHISYLPGDLAQACRATAAQNNVTLFVFLLSVYADALAEHFGQDDFAIGMAAANRLQSSFRRTVGMFVNTVAVRRSVDQDPLQRIQDLAVRAASAYDGQDVPFSFVVAASRARRTPHTTPLYQVTFSFDDSPLPALQLPDAIGEVVELQSGYAKVDLGLTVIPQREQRLVHGSGGGDPRIKLIWQHRLAALDPAELQSLAARFGRLLHQSVSASR